MKVAHLKEAVTSVISPKMLDSVESAVDMKQKLADYAPKTLKEAVRLKTFLHIVENNKKSLSTNCNVVLDKFNTNESTLIDPDTGLSVKRRKKSVKNYNDCENCTDIEQQIGLLDLELSELSEPIMKKIEALKQQLEQARTAAGYTEQISYTYAANLPK